MGTAARRAGRPGHAPEPQLTPEQLRLAFRHLARPGWPETLEEALAHPLRGPCVRGLARCLSRGGVAFSRHYRPPTPAHAAPVPPTPRHPPAPGAHPRARFDAKRRAANDFDDED